MHVLRFRENLRAYQRSAVAAALLLWPLLSSSGQGAPAGPPIAELPSAPLVLGALYDSLSRSGPQIQVAEALARAVEHRAPALRRPPDPLFQIGVMNRSVPSFAPMVPLGMTQLQLMQMLPLGGKLALAGAAADARTRAARHRVAGVRWELRARAADYLEVLKDVGEVGAGPDRLEGLGGRAVAGEDDRKPQLDHLAPHRGVAAA